MTQGEEFLPPNVRTFVAGVGFLATWWVGLIIGIVYSFVGLSLPSEKLMYKAALRSLGIAFFSAASFGILGWIFAKLFLTDVPVNINGISLLKDPCSFITVGSIHNFGYI